MKTIQSVIDAKVSEMISGGVIEETIQKSVEKAITRALENQFEYYGSITRLLEESIKEGLQINTKDIPFDTYNAQMLAAIKIKLGNMFHGQAYEHFLSQIDVMLKPVPKEISIEDFLEKIASMWKTDEPWNADDLDDYMTVEIEKYDRSWVGDSPHGSWTIKCWKQKERGYSSRSADLNLYVSGGKIRISHNQHYNPTCFNDEDAFVFKLYAAGTIITGIADCDPDDLDLCLKEDKY